MFLKKFEVESCCKSRYDNIECGEFLQGGIAMWEIVKSIREDDGLRCSFNELAKKTFSLDFEDWYQNGFWGDCYIPYSAVSDGKVLANVSVNRTDMLWNGSKKRLIQLGTVMTEETCRNRGMIRRLMEEIEQDFGEEADGIYLFANDSVLDFYPKFGFRKAVECQYSQKVLGQGEGIAKAVPMKSGEDWKKLVKAIEESAPQGRFELTNNSSLIMFYVTKFMQDHVYELPDQQAYAIAERKGDELILYNIFAREKVEPETVAKAFGGGIHKLSLCFVPWEDSGYEKEVLCKEDTTLFVKGDLFTEFEREQLRFPDLAYA